MQRVKTRIFSGSVCEQIVFNVPDRVRDIKKAEPRPRFKTPEEREQHRIGISKRNHARLFNQNFGPSSLYSTITLNNEYEVHTFQEARRWKKAGKLDKPDREPSTEVKRNYTENKPPRPPKGYILVESKATKYGYLYYKYVRQPEPPKKARRKKAGSG